MPVIDKAADLVSRYMPENRVKDALRQRYRKRNIQDRVETEPITSSGIEEGYPYIQLKNDIRFYGFETSDDLSREYDYLSRSDKNKIIPEAFWAAYWHSQSYFEKDFPREKHYRIKEGDTVVEVGSHVGYYTAKLSDRVGKSGQVIAIEAHPDNYQMLRKNVSKNDLTNVETINKAISHKNGTLDFYETDGNSGKDYSIRKDNFQDIDRELNPLKIESKTLDMVLDNLGVSSVDYAVITVNKAEYNVLQGMERTLQTDLDLSCVASTDTENIINLLENKGLNTRLSQERVGPVVYASSRKI